MAATQAIEWTDFAWQGICLRVPQGWNLGKVEGDHRSGYARLDDAEIVRLEVEWRELGTRGRDAELSQLVDRYLEKLRKKAAKSELNFAVERRARFLRDKRWLQGFDYETFVWEADFRAYNLARSDPGSGRILLVRVLLRPREDPGALVEQVLRSLEDRSRAAQVPWSVYGLRFAMPAGFELSGHELKSGHIQLSFAKERQMCRVHRLSMANMLLKGTTLEEWYPLFFKKQLRDFHWELGAREKDGLPALGIEGRPRNRWRQLLRPLPFIHPRPRQYLEGIVWHCARTNKICLVEHIYRKKNQKSDLTRRVSDGYICR